MNLKGQKQIFIVGDNFNVLLPARIENKKKEAGMEKFRTSISKALK